MTEQNLAISQTSLCYHIEQWMLACMDLGTEIIELERAKSLRSEEEQRQYNTKCKRFMEERVKSGSVPWDLLEDMNVPQPRDEQFLKMFRSGYKISLFLVALNKVARWSRKLVKVAPELAPHVDVFMADFGVGKDLRDILEHDDEYFTGGGRNPDKFVFSQDNNILNASGVTIQGEEIFLGHQLSVQEMLKAVQRLREAVIVPNNPLVQHG